MLTILKNFLIENKKLNINSPLFQFLDSNSFYIEEFDDYEAEIEDEAEDDDDASEVNDIPQEEQSEEEGVPSDAAYAIQVDRLIPDFCRKKRSTIALLKNF